MLGRGFDIFVRGLEESWWQEKESETLGEDLCSFFDKFPMNLLSDLPGIIVCIPRREEGIIFSSQGRA
jgi:hypothetical protein